MRTVFDRLVEQRLEPERRDMPSPDELIARGITTQGTIAHLAQRLPPAPTLQPTPGDKLGWLNSLALHDDCRMRLDSLRQAAFKQVSFEGRKAFNTARMVSRQEQKERHLTVTKRQVKYRGIER